MKKQRKKKKGFTLLELLAVIIILAIIALIATPIVMRVIENSKKAAAERGAENYVRAVETQALALRGQGTILEGTYGINSNGNLCPNNAASCGENEIKIEMNGTKPSSGSVVILNGKVVASGANNTSTTLTIGDYTATIAENGSATATKNESGASTSRYYHWGTGNISGGLPTTNIDTNLSNINTNGHPFYLAFDSEDGETIDAAYVCFLRNNTEYCIQGDDGETTFSDNQNILDTAFPSCSLFEGTYNCSADDLSVYEYSKESYEHNSVHASGGLEFCNVSGNGGFSCASW